MELTEQQLAEAQGASSFDSLVGLRVTQASGEEVQAVLPVAPHLHQPYGIVHGGVWCTVVETCASIGAALWLGDRGNVVGVHNATDFLRAVREGEVRVRAVPVHRGRTQQLWAVTVHDEQERLVAQGQVRLANVSSQQIGG